MWGAKPKQAVTLQAAAACRSASSAGTGRPVVPHGAMCGGMVAATQGAVSILGPTTGPALDAAATWV